MTTAKPNIPFDLDSALEHISHWLPTQGPIKDFIHHNTLHAVQNYGFHDGVAIAAKVFGARSYLPMADYQARYRQGRIKDEAITWALNQSGCVGQEQAALKEQLFVDDANKHYPPMSLANHGIRNRWLSHIEVDLNSLVQPLLFRLVGNFLDQGISRWTLAKKSERFWACVQRLTFDSFLALFPFDAPEAREMLKQSPEQVITACLHEIVGCEPLYQQYLLEMLLAHPGWSGMVRLIELNPKALLEPREISLKEMIAVELAAEWAILRKKRSKGFITVVKTPGLDEVPLLADYETDLVVPLPLKVWHEAMEYSLYLELLTALTAQDVSAPSEQTPIAQALFCLDDRECSVRRYLEAANPDIETFGAAGFFGIDFLYQGFDDAYPVAQCPNILNPKHLIKESSSKPEPDKSTLAEGWSDLHIKPHSLLRGWLFTQILGLGYAVRMLWDVFRPGPQLLKGSPAIVMIYEKSSLEEL